MQEAEHIEIKKVQKEFKKSSIYSEISETLKG